MICFSYLSNEKWFCFERKMVLLQLMQIDFATNWNKFLEIIMLYKLNSIIIQWIPQFFWNCGSLLWFFLKKWRTIQFNFAASNFWETSPIEKKLRLFPICSRYFAKHLHISHNFFIFYKTSSIFYQVVTVFWYNSIFLGDKSLFSLYQFSKFMKNKPRICCLPTPMAF